MPAVFQLNSGISAMPFGSPFCPNLTAKWPEFLYIFEHISYIYAAVFQRNSSNFGPKIRAFQPRNLVFHFARIRAFKRWKRTIWSRFLPENRD